MNHLIVLHVHKSLTDTLDLVKVANKFVERREGGKAIFRTYKY